MAGEIFPSDTVFITIAVGSARSDKHGELELLTGLHGAPMIHCVKTGKHWAIGWQELIGMAVEAGVADAEAPDAP